MNINSFLPSFNSVTPAFNDPADILLHSLSCADVLLSLTISTDAIGSIALIYTFAVAVELYTLDSNTLSPLIVLSSSGARLSTVR